jgi:cell division protein FtsN
MKIDSKSITSQISKFIDFLKRYKLEEFIIIVCLIFGFLIMKISVYSTQEPSQSSLDEKIKTVKLPKVDEEAVRNIQKLEDQNIEVQSLFNEARNNPFSE